MTTNPPPPARIIMRTALAGAIGGGLLGSLLLVPTVEPYQIASALALGGGIGGMVGGTVAFSGLLLWAVAGIGTTRRAYRRLFAGFVNGALVFALMRWRSGPDIEIEWFHIQVSGVVAVLTVVMELWVMRPLRTATARPLDQPVELR